MNKYSPILHYLQTQIAEEKFANGKRLPSESELARRFHVSRPTAARAIRELQQLGLITRRAGSGSYVADERSNAKVKTFALLVPGLGNTEILDPICNEITRYAQSLGNMVLWGDATSLVSTSDEMLELCRKYIHRGVDGVFFAPIESIAGREAANLEIEKILGQAKIPIVLLDRDILEFPNRSANDLIGIDNFRAAFILTENLIATGSQRPRFLARPHSPSTADLRVAGMREAIARHGLRSTPNLACFGDPEDLAYVQDVVLADGIDTILCANDRTAALLLRTLARLHVRVPNDISIAGFDDVRYATLLAVPLTTIRQPCKEIGRAAIHAMLDRIASPETPPRDVSLQFELIVRRSSGGAN